MVEYKYLSWDKTTKVEKVIKELNELAKDGWEVVSHSQTDYGMSVILEKFMG